MPRRLLAYLLTPLLLLGVAAVTAGAAGDQHAAGFVRAANAERSQRGLPAYVVRSDLVAVAARHSARMAEQSSLHHNARLGSEVSGWQVVGENVGNGATVESIHAAFMDSPKHRANIVATDYTEIGVATVTDGDGLIWVTQVFRLPVRTARPAARATREAARTVVRVPVRRAAPAAPLVLPAAAVRPATPVAAPLVAERPDPAAFAGALAPGTAVAGDPFASAVAYAGALTALAR